jgi:hypothetical protein
MTSAVQDARVVIPTKAGPEVKHSHHPEICFGKAEALRYNNDAKYFRTTPEAATSPAINLYNNLISI